MKTCGLFFISSSYIYENQMNIKQGFWLRKSSIFHDHSHFGIFNCSHIFVNNYTNFSHKNIFFKLKSLISIFSCEISKSMKIHLFPWCIHHWNHHPQILKSSLSLEDVAGGPSKIQDYGSIQISSIGSSFYLQIQMFLMYWSKQSG